MRTLLSLLLAFSPVLSHAHGGGPYHYSWDWKLAVDSLSINVQIMLLAGENQAVDEEVLEIGKCLARINALAQKPCRRNGDKCRKYLDRIFDEVVRQNLERATPRDANQVARRAQVLEALAEGVRDDNLRRNTIAAAREWRTDLEGRFGATLQGAAAAITTGVFAGAFANYLHAPLDQALGAGLAASVATAGVAYLVRNHLPLTRRFRVRTNAVAAPVNQCLELLTPVTRAA